MPGYIIEGAGFRATVLVSDRPSDTGHRHVQITVDGATHEITHEIVSHLFDVYTKGRDAFIRARPTTTGEREFDTKVTRHRGFARFSYRLEPGQHHNVDAIVGFGDIPKVGEA